MSITAAFTTVFTIGRIIKDSIDSAGYPVPLTWSTSYIARGYHEPVDTIRGLERFVDGNPEAVVTHRMFFLYDINNESMSLNERHEAIAHSAFVFSTHKAEPRFLFNQADFIKGHHWEVLGQKVVPSG